MDVTSNFQIERAGRIPAQQAKKSFRPAEQVFRTL